MRTIARVPAIHFREIIDKTGVVQNPLYARLNRLKKMKLVKEKRTGNRRQFYVTDKGLQAIHEDGRAENEDFVKFLNSIPQGRKLIDEMEDLMIRRSVGDKPYPSTITIHDVNTSRQTIVRDPDKVKRYHLSTQTMEDHLYFAYLDKKQRQMIEQFEKLLSKRGKKEAVRSLQDYFREKLVKILYDMLLKYAEASTFPDKDKAGAYIVKGMQEVVSELVLTPNPYICIGEEAPLLVRHPDIVRRAIAGVARDMGIAEQLIDLLMSPESVTEEEKPSM